ncbi:succinyl-diaminopimelate desuccinylase [Candidatus Phycosocius bacilliformis]|uniref:Succinyl-diaminopimelate desuccinylase n=1 Tax=Candidatus Phycosocius bacilliformis TaxID=1445552 RepID=A0A2P2EB06_9PROT|nr:succinyl-diaminopimelate desuccinylase [Candidatus Phycosocius bacilliformis]GBF58233.1 succinyl-diaminopimelate desuccinylase [Candidatus Phycosocius bacilliformis]
MTAALLDPIHLACDLIRKPSVTPADLGALDVVQAGLEAMGFWVRRYQFEDIDNLYARYGDQRPNFCFAGHTDVVPTGDLAQWQVDPFEAALKDGFLIGRGAADMKGGIAAFLAAVGRFLAKNPKPAGSISLLITGDEEGIALNGTKRLLQAITEEGEILDHCLVGEPTNPDAMGDMIKNGRRGSLNCTITVTGVQGHVAYPHKAANPVRVLIDMLHRLQTHPLDQGAPGFQPSNLEVVTVDVGNPASNIIPEKATARFNIRFNTAHSGASLTEWLQAEAATAQDGFAGRVDLAIMVSGEAFFTPPGLLTDLIQDACAQVTGRRPELSTTGGTSDARFIKDYCPVCEFGLVGATMHQINERVATADIETLTQIYETVLQGYFAKAQA